MILKFDTSFTAIYFIKLLHLSRECSLLIIIYDFLPRYHKGVHYDYET